MECLDCWFQELGRPKLRVEPKLDHVVDVDMLMEVLRVLLGNGASPAGPNATVQLAATSSSASAVAAAPATTLGAAAVGADPNEDASQAPHTCVAVCVRASVRVCVCDGVVVATRRGLFGRPTSHARTHVAV